MAASRKWICVRLATFEDADEAAFLQTFFGRRDLPNTAFVLLAPDGRTRLTRTQRGPLGLVGEATDDGPAELARYLDRVAADYQAKTAPAALPQTLDFRRALNVAACDSQPLLVLLAPGEAGRSAASARIAKLAWDARYVGRLQYAVVADAADLEALDRRPAGSGVLLVEPGRFGLTGQVVDEIPLKDLARLPARIDTFLKERTPPDKEHRRHVRDGRRNGIKWQTVVPQTDGPAAGK